MSGIKKQWFDMEEKELQEYVEQLVAEGLTNIMRLVVADQAKLARFYLALDAEITRREE